MKRTPITDGTEETDPLRDLKNALLSKTEYLESAALSTGSNHLIVHLRLSLLRQTTRCDPTEEKCERLGHAQEQLQCRYQIPLSPS